MKGLKIPKGGNQNRMKSMKIPKGCNHNPYIEEEQTTQWPNEKVQKDKQQSTKHISKTKDRVTRIPLKSRGELGYSGRVGSSCICSIIYFKINDFYFTIL